MVKRKKEKKKITAQNSIPYKEMAKNGTCRIRDGMYSKSIRFLDMNYRLAKGEEKENILDNWCDFLNYFDSTIHFEISFVHHSGNIKSENAIRLEPQGDAYDEIRAEFAQMLQEQLEKGSSGLVKDKYITFTVEARNYKEAKARLERIEADILGNFRAFGVTAYPMNGVERLRVLYEIFNPDRSPFHFSFDDLIKSGLNTKDYISPTSFVFRSGREFEMGDTVGRASFLRILAPKLTDKLLLELLEMDRNLIISLHIQSIEQENAIKLIKNKMTDVNRMKLEEQKKAVQGGYDMDLIPSDLNTYGNDVKHLLEELLSQNERLFLVTILIVNTANSRKELAAGILQTAGIAQKYNCSLRCLDYMQEKGLMSAIPLGCNLVPIKRTLTTMSTAIFVPFSTQDIIMEGDALYYGINPLSNNIIMADRKQLKNPNGLFLGTPGSGKSYAAKREILNLFLVTRDDVIIVDPEAEYYPLVRELGGQVIHLSPNSKDFINPMDIHMDYSGDDDSPLSVKSDFILSFCEVVMKSRNGMDPEEKSIIDRCLPVVYQKYFEDPRPENMPILGDLYECLRNQKEEKAQKIATALEIYVNGSSNFFNHRTTVELNNRIVCFDLKELGKNLKKLGMLIVHDQVWNRVTCNRTQGKATWYYIDEMHLLLKEEQTAAYTVEIWKRFRKWGGIPSGLTQNVKDLFLSPEIENILENSDFILMLNQGAGDREILAKRLNISGQQLEYVTNSHAGQGLLFFGSTILPFRDNQDPDSRIYLLMSTKPKDVERMKTMNTE